MRFRPEQHLRRQGDIRAAREQGSREDCRSFTIWCRHRGPDETPELKLPRAGFVASIAAVGAAVQRTRAKRRLREVFRCHQHRVPPACDLLFVARNAVVRRPFAELEERFIEACRRITAAAPLPAK